MAETRMVRCRFVDNKVKMARKPGKKQKEISVGCTGKVKDEKEI